MLTYNENYIKFAINDAAKRGLRLITVNNDPRLAKYTDAVFAAGPSEFVSLIKHAGFVYTDSFHGTVFSLLYHRSFVTFRKKGPYSEDKYKPFSVVYGTFLINDEGRRIKIRRKRDAFLRDDYITAFMRGLIFRDSCYTCTYAGPRRCSDITIADFWGLDRCGVPQANGVSLLLINSEKGITLSKDSLRETIWEERPVSEAVNGNGQLIKPSVKPEDREQFLKDYSNNPRQAYKKHLKRYRHQYRAKYLYADFDRFIKRHRLIAAIDSRCPILSMLVGKAIYEYSKR